MAGKLPLHLTTKHTRPGCRPDLLELGTLLWAQSWAVLGDRERPSEWVQVEGWKQGTEESGRPTHSGLSELCVCP